MTLSDRAGRVEAVAALAEPLRRRLYLYVASQPEPVGRDEAAERFGVSRAVAAFHLDKLAELGLLEVEFKRRHGTGGPGAGRPAKLYRASATEVAFSVPPREYELAGRLLAEAVHVSASEGTPVDAALEGAARKLGRSLGVRARQEAAASEPSRESLVHAACDVLRACSYEPHDDGADLVLLNCPFHVLAEAYQDVVCEMNLALLTGMTDELGEAGLETQLIPHRSRCCVRLTRVSPSN